MSGFSSSIWFCPTCGHRNQPDFNHCPKCGSGHPEGNSFAAGERSQGPAAVKNNLGSMRTATGELSFVFSVSNSGEANVLIFATNPSNQRVAGVMLQLDAVGFNEFQRLVQQAGNTISQLKASGRIARMLYSPARAGTTEVEIGQISKIVGALKFSLFIHADQSAYLQVYAFDPTNLRKTGIIFFLTEKEVADVQSLINKTEESARQTGMFAPNSVHVSFVAGTTTSAALSAPEARRPQSPTQSYRVICPQCQAQEVYQVSGSNNRYNFTCPSCRTTFQSEIVRIRGKNSRGNKKDFRRAFSVRVYDSTGQERLIEFVNSGTVDFELRSRDEAIFSYQNNTLKVVQNLTVGQYMKVSAPYCYIATYLYGPQSNQVSILRRFRDDYLLKRKIGAKLVLVYYCLSRVLITLIGNSKGFQFGSRCALAPVISAIEKTLYKIGKGNCDV